MVQQRRIIGMSRQPASLVALQRKMLVNWEEHEMKLEGIKVADKGKSLFTNTELEMAALLPSPLTKRVRSLATWPNAAEEGDSELWYQQGEAEPHTYWCGTSTCPVSPGWGDWKPKAPQCARCQRFSGSLGLRWGHRANRKNWCRRMRGYGGAKISLFPPQKCMPGAVRLNAIESLDPSI